MNLKVLHGSEIISDKIKNGNLYYRKLVTDKINKSTLTLENLIVIEYINDDLNDESYLIKQNILGCWNSECNSVIYSSHNKSFNQSIISKEMHKLSLSEPSHMTLLLGDNLYPRPDFIKIKQNITEQNNNTSNDKKFPINYKSIINNGFMCFKNAVQPNHPFFLILGNHDEDINVMDYEINLTYTEAILTYDTEKKINILNQTNGWIMPEEFYVLKIKDWHYLMLNSNVIIDEDIDNNIGVKSYQEHLIKLYLDTYYSSIEDKKVIICIHEPFYALGHKEKKNIIDNRTSSFYTNIVLQYKHKIHSIFAADEHDTQHLYDKINDIQHIVASGAPYSGGDIIFYPHSHNTEQFDIIQTYNSNILPINLLTKNRLTTNFNIIEVSYQNTTLTINNNINFDEFINDFRKKESVIEKKTGKKKKGDKLKPIAGESIPISGESKPISGEPQKTDLNIEILNAINGQCKEFNEKYEKIYKYIELSNNFETNLNVNFTQEKINDLEMIYEGIVRNMEIAKL